MHDAVGGGPIGRGNIRALTGIRGVAAVWVAVYHFWLQQPWPHDAGTVGWGALLAHGYLAVDVFFVLSGFMMALSYGRLFRAPSARGFGVFLTRRFARIYPLYIAFLTFAVVYRTARGLDHFAGTTLVSNALMVQAWGIGGSIIAQSWSLSVELLAYLLFPLLFFATHRRGVPSAALVLAASVGALAVVARSPPLPNWPKMGPLDAVYFGHPMPVLRCVSEFCFGLIACRLASSAAGRRWAASDLLAAGSLLALAGLAAVRGSDLAFVGCAAVAIPVLSGRNVSASLLGGAAFVFLGEISYAVYITHNMMVHLVGLPFKGAGLQGGAWTAAYFSAFCLVTVSVSWCLHVVVERPCRTVLRRLELVFDPRAEEALAARGP